MSRRVEFASSEASIGLAKCLDSALHLAYACHMPDGERHVRLFKNGRSQAVRIPREFELPGDEAVIRKEGTRLIIEPVPRKSLLAILETLEPLDEDFPEIPDLPAEPVSF